MINLILGRIVPVDFHSYFHILTRDETDFLHGIKIKSLTFRNTDCGD